MSAVHRQVLSVVSNKYQGCKGYEFTVIFKTTLEYTHIILLLYNNIILYFNSDRLSNIPYIPLPYTPFNIYIYIPIKKTKNIINNLPYKKNK